MNHCFGSSRSNWLLTSLISLIFVGVALAGTTGKITGTVEDADGSPLPGAAVTVDGSRLGATADADGQYMILQVPPGIITVTAQLIGFRSTTVTGVRINTDLTSQINFELSEQTLEVDAITVIAQRPDIEADVTSSQTIVDAARVAELPVNQMLDVLNFQPGVNVERDNELEIRGGGPSEIRFQVDGLDRTDGLTSKSYTQLNQMLVSEVTLLTGGFNAEYGNVRSGMVNVVVKEGSEKGGLIPWVAGVYSFAPSQQKHFGPNGYSEDQYSYRLIAGNDTALTGGPVYWQDLYEITQSPTDSVQNDLGKWLPAVEIDGELVVVPARSGGAKVFNGWDKRISSLNAKRLGSTALYNHNGWELADILEAWEYESNMNESVWSYGHQPDWGLDLASGLALPNKMGGLIVGYAYNKEMTPVPATRPHYIDQSFETKLTLTPTDKLKLRISFMKANNKQTGAGARDLPATRGSPEGTLADGVSSVNNGEPAALRTTGPLVLSVLGTVDSNNKLNPAFNNPLDGEFQQWGGSLTYTVGANTFVTASFGRSDSESKMSRSLPRADMMDPTAWPDTAIEARYQPSNSFTFPGLLDQAWDFANGSATPPSLEYVTTPGNVIFRTPYGHPNMYQEVPTEAIFVTKDFTWANRTFETRRDTVPDTTYSVQIVSPQGFSPILYDDLSGLFQISGGGTILSNGGASQNVARVDMTHATGGHTIKSGAEYISRDLQFHVEESDGLIGPAGRNSNYRDFGGDYPAAQPKILGFYLQDKYESDGMITNVGVRLERFDAGHVAFLYDDMFNGNVFGTDNSYKLFQQLVSEAGWKDEWGTILNPELKSVYYAIDDSLMNNYNVHAPGPSDVVSAWPANDNEVHWKIAPRFGISHPVSKRTKFFFNYGVFYSMQKPLHMYGYGSHNTRPGAIGVLDWIYNPNLRPANTTMYEVGIEHVLPFGAVFKATGYAKYNEDQPANLDIYGTNIKAYHVFRNGNYEDVSGYELQFARTSGRFVNGSLSYERSTSRTGEVGYLRISNILTNWETSGLPFVRENRPEGFMRMFLRLGTPMEWGSATGGWALSLIQEWRSGGEVVYNPDSKERRELPDENILPVTDFWNTDMKLTKRFLLPGGRYVSTYMDISNVFNTKHLFQDGVSNYDIYLAEVYRRRLGGEDVDVGDESTFDWLNEPYVGAGGSSVTKPISASTDWLQFMNPRFYRFGVRFEL